LEYPDIGVKAHPTLDLLIEQFSLLKYKNSSVTVTQSFAMTNMLPAKLTDFIRYQGSLTTPNCSEVVTWTVFKEPIIISHTQLYALRAISHNGKTDSEDHPLEDNFRPPQPLNNRPVYKTQNYANPAKPKTQDCLPKPSETKTCKAPTFELSLLGYAMVALLVWREVLGL
jgi:hypothetical protein